MKKIISFIKKHLLDTDHVVKVLYSYNPNRIELVTPIYSSIDNDGGTLFYFNVITSGSLTTFSMYIDEIRERVPQPLEVIRGLFYNTNPDDGNILITNDLLEIEGYNITVNIHTINIHDNG